MTSSVSAPAAPTTNDDVWGRIAHANEALERKYIPELEAAHAQLRSVAEALKEYSELLRMVGVMRIEAEEREKDGVADDHSMRTMVSMGCNSYMQAEIQDTRYIMMDVGLGYFVELTLAEAEKTIPAVFEAKAQLHNRLVEDVRRKEAHITTVRAYVSELLEQQQKQQQQ